MKDHTLMQTIARANRVTSWKVNGVEKRNGEIVDYYNVFRNMRKALKDYAQGQEGQDQPVREKKELFKLLDDAIAQGMTFCSDLEIDLPALFKSKDIFKNLGTFNEYADKLLAKDEWRKGFAVYENTITSLYEACKPEILGKPIVRSVALVQDWFKDQQSKIRVRSTVESVLDSHLPKSYDRVVFTEKCNNVFDLMVNYASQGLKWAA
jgi:type I restriction enzyme, R subunit